MTASVTCSGGDTQTQTPLRHQMCCTTCCPPDCHACLLCCHTGVGGAGVLDRLNDAFHQDLSEAESSGRPYHYIIFEGGINDLLLKHRNAPEIFGRMKELWAQANAAGATVVVIPTLPTKVKYVLQECE